MIDIALNNIEKYYGANYVLKGVTFEVHRGERVALLGKNGTGKSTLFKIITGIEGHDQGEIAIRKGVSIGFLKQIPEFSEEFTLREVLFTAFQELFVIYQEMSRLEELMADNPAKEILEKYGELQALFESRNGYLIDERIRRVCLGLNIDQSWLGRKFKYLSGGEKTRVMLAQLILQSPEILLLDEPTNHLDLNSIEWLEGFLTDYTGTIVLISHDRYFLDKVVDRVVELVNGKAEIFEGNFTYYAREKEARYQNQLKHYEEEQKKIHQLEAAAKRMHEWAKIADNPGMHRQAFCIEKRIERMEKTEKPVLTKQMKNRFAGSSFSGQEVIIARGLVKAYHGNTVLQGLDLLVQKGERLAIFGDNGSGKSTLLKIFTGEIAPDSGTVKIGESIRYAYLPQVVTFPLPSATVLETVRTELREGEDHVRRLLDKFNFRNEDLLKAVGSLSGGEKSRLKLCLLMQRELNLLLLDEPTNHLDIDSREWLEKALAQFPGTMVFVSHDRFFVNRFATRIAELNHGLITNYYGDYNFYKTRKFEAAEQIIQYEKESPKAPKKAAPKKKSMAPDIKLEDTIVEWEARLTAIDAEMLLYGNDYDRLVSLSKERKEIETTISHLYEQWVLADSFKE